MKAKTKDHSPGFAGASDFMELLKQAQPDCAVVAVKAHIDEVSDEFADIVGTTMIHREVPVKPAGEFQEAFHLVPIVQVKDGSWPVVIRSVLYMDEELVQAAQEEAQEFSARLSTRAMSFTSEDTSGTMSFKLFEKGKSLEDIEWQRDGEFFRFKSSLRKRPAVEVVDDAFIDGLLRELGIYLPPCYPVVSGGGKAWLAAEEKSIGAIERADLVELENEFEDEEEDED